jgi:hypothetical protein
MKSTFRMALASMALVSLTSFGQVISWSVEGETLWVKEQPFGINYSWRPTNIDARGSGVRYGAGGWNRNLYKWIPMGTCQVGEETGWRYVNSDSLGNLVFNFDDGSWLLLRVGDEESCEVRPQLPRLKYGTYSHDWEVVDGGGRFEGARGAATSAGDWQLLWDSPIDKSEKFTGDWNITLE